jgi:hypothetical protein
MEAVDATAVSCGSFLPDQSPLICGKGLAIAGNGLIPICSYVPVLSAVIGENADFDPSGGGMCFRDIPGAPVKGAPGDVHVETGQAMRFGSDLPTDAIAGSFGKHPPMPAASGSSMGATGSTGARALPRAHETSASRPGNSSAGMRMDVGGKGGNTPIVGGTRWSGAELAILAPVAKRAATGKKLRRGTIARLVERLSGRTDSGVRTKLRELQGKVRLEMMHHGRPVPEAGGAEPHPSGGIPRQEHHLALTPDAMQARPSEDHGPFGGSLGSNSVQEGG